MTPAQTDVERAALQPSVADAAKVLLDAISKGMNPLDVTGRPEIEDLAVKWSGNRGDPVIQLEIAEEFMAAALRALAKGDDNAR